MSKVTSKLQLILPKTLAVKHGTQPGDDVRFEGPSELMSMVPEGADRAPAALDPEARLRLFDAATARQEVRPARRRERGHGNRGWTREELYERGRSHTD